MSADPFDEAAAHVVGNKVIPLKANGQTRGDAAPGHQHPKLNTIWADDIQLDLDKVGLVDGLLETTGLTVVYGESGSGKTFAVLDLACHVAAGLPWRGMKVEQGVVIYIAAESPGSVQRRLWAWKRRHEVDHLPVLVVRSSVDLLNGSVDALVYLIAQARERTGQKVALVVVDTLARAMTGNENAPEDMGKFVAACGRIGEAADGHVVIVHHSGKDVARGARGHSSLRAATDCEMEVTRNGDDRTLTVKKSRDGEDGAAYGFKLETVELGTNPNGRMVTTCVTVPADVREEPAAKITKLPGGKNQRTTLESLKAAIVDKGRPGPNAPDIPRQARGVDFDTFEQYAFRYLTQKTPKDKRQAFRRAVETLGDERFIRHVDGFFWVPATGGGKSGKSGNSANASFDAEPEPSAAKAAKAANPFRDASFAAFAANGATEPKTPPEWAEEPLGGSAPDDEPEGFGL